MTRMLVAVGVMAVVACAVGPSPEDATGSTGDGEGGASSGAPTTSGAGSTGPQPGTGSIDATSTTGGGGGEACGSSSGTPDGEVRPCTMLEQDCPKCEKCAAYAEGAGSSWNAAKCVPVQGDGQAGDPCTAAGMRAWLRRNMRRSGSVLFRDDG